MVENCRNLSEPRRILAQEPSSFQNLPLREEKKRVLPYSVKGWSPGNLSFPLRWNFVTLWSGLAIVGKIVDTDPLYFIWVTDGVRRFCHISQPTGYERPTN